MNKLKRQDGWVSLIVMLIVCVIVVFCIFCILDIYGFIDVPEEYSITRFLKTSEEVVSQTEASSSENKNIRKRVKNDTSNDDNNTEFVIGNTVSGNNEQEDYVENNDEYEDFEYGYNRYYYSQLDDTAKTIYDKIIENREELKSGTYTLEFGKEFNKLLNTSDGEAILNNAFQSAVNAALLDNPDLFFLDITKMYLLTHSTTYAFTGTTYEVSIGANDGETYLNSSFSPSNIETAESRLKSIRRSIVNQLDGNNIDKIQQIHDYLVDNLEYDSTFSNDNIYNIYGALINNKTVCEGYAKAFKYILDEVGIPCVVVCGVAQNSKGEIENHAWNYVLLDGAWYAIDVTWDDPIVVGGGSLSQDSRYKYYLRGFNALFPDHEEDGNVVEGVYFDYPELNEEDY